MIYAAVRKLLFRLDAESVHEWTVEQIRRVQQIPLALRLIEALARPPASPRLLLGGNAPGEYSRRHERGPP